MLMLMLSNANAKNEGVKEWEGGMGREGGKSYVLLLLLLLRKTITRPRLSQAKRLAAVKTHNFAKF